MIASTTLLVSLMSLGAADVAAAQTPAIQGPATRLALQLALHRVELVEKQILYQPTHPALKQQLRHVKAMERSLKTLRAEGARVDGQQVAAVLDRQLQRVKVELNVARQDLTRSHPRLALLELRLQVLTQLAARR